MYIVHTLILQVQTLCQCMQYNCNTAKVHAYMSRIYYEIHNIRYMTTLFFVKMGCTCISKWSMLLEYLSPSFLWEITVYNLIPNPVYCTLIGYIVVWTLKFALKIDLSDLTSFFFFAQCGKHISFQCLMRIFVIE